MICMYEIDHLGVQQTLSPRFDLTPFLIKLRTSQNISVKYKVFGKNAWCNSDRSQGRPRQATQGAAVSARELHAPDASINVAHQ